MAPEQVTGGPISPQTDIYSWGVVMFTMLTGRRPFEGSALTCEYRDAYGEDGAVAIEPAAWVSCPYRRFCMSRRALVIASLLVGVAGASAMTLMSAHKWACAQQATSQAVAGVV